MEKKNAKVLPSGGFINKFKEAWSHNSMVSTLFALLVMVLIQAVVQGINAGSFAGMFGKMWMAWLNILRNNTYAGVIALGMCFAIISGGIDLSVGSTLCAIGKEGVITTLTPKLSPDEVAKFQNSAKVLKDVIAQIQI